ncbi:MAG: Hint domain-containing protein [Planctomycetota bacterium]
MVEEGEYASGDFNAPNWEIEYEETVDTQSLAYTKLSVGLRDWTKTTYTQNSDTTWDYETESHDGQSGSKGEGEQNSYYREYFYTIYATGVFEEVSTYTDETGRTTTSGTPRSGSSRQKTIGDVTANGSSEYYDEHYSPGQRTRIDGSSSYSSYDEFDYDSARESTASHGNSNPGSGGLALTTDTRGNSQGRGLETVTEWTQIGDPGYYGTGSGGDDVDYGSGDGNSSGWHAETTVQLDMSSSHSYDEWTNDAGYNSNYAGEVGGKVYGRHPAGMDGGFPLQKSIVESSYTTPKPLAGPTETGATTAAPHFPQVQPKDAGAIQDIPEVQDFQLSVTMHEGNRSKTNRNKGDSRSNLYFNNGRENETVNDQSGEATITAPPTPKTPVAVKVGGDAANTHSISWDGTALRTHNGIERLSFEEQQFQKHLSEINKSIGSIFEENVIPVSRLKSLIKSGDAWELYPGTKGSQIVVRIGNLQLLFAMRMKDNGWGFAVGERGYRLSSVYVSPEDLTASLYENHQDLERETRFANKDYEIARNISSVVPFFILADKLAYDEGEWSEVALYTASDLTLVGGMLVSTAGKFAGPGSRALKAMLATDAGVNLIFAGLAARDALNSESNLGAGGNALRVLLHLAGATISAKALKDAGRSAQAARSRRLSGESASIAPPEVSSTRRTATELADAQLPITNNPTCFVAGTKVATPSGPIPIEKLQSGSEVFTRSETNPDAPIVVAKIDETFTRSAMTMEITLTSGLLETTSEHPFYVVGRGWTKAGDLSPGDMLSTDAPDRPAGIRKVESLTEVRTVYNFSVSTHHTYFVHASNDAPCVWVHNSRYEVRPGDDGIFRIFDLEENRFVKNVGGDDIVFSSKTKAGEHLDSLLRSAPKGGLRGLDTSTLSPITRKNSTLSSDAFRLSSEVVDDVVRINGKPANGAADFVITKSGELRFGRRHLELSDEADSVFAAGEVFFENGKIVAINRESGHFRPSAADLDRAAEFFRSTRLTAGDFEAVNFRFNPDRFIRP